MFSYVAHSLLMGDHGEVIAIALQYFIVNSKAGLGCWTALVDVCNIDSLQSKRTKYITSIEWFFSSFEWGHERWSKVHIANEMHLACGALSL